MTMPNKHNAPNLTDVVRNGVVGSASFVGLPGRPMSPVHGHRVVSQRSPSPKGSPGHSPMQSARHKQEKLAEDLRARGGAPGRYGLNTNTSQFFIQK